MFEHHGRKQWVKEGTLESNDILQGNKKRNPLMTQIQIKRGEPGGRRILEDTEVGFYGMGVQLCQTSRVLLKIILIK